MKDNWDRRVLGIVILLASACAGAPAFAADAPCGTVKSEWCAAAYTGAVSVVTRGEKGEYVTARVSLAGPAYKSLGVFARVDLTGAQDGGALDYTNPKTFRTIEGSGGLSHPVLGDLALAAVAGATWSVEGDTGKPIDSRLFTLAALARLPIGDGGYVYVGGGHHGPVGGPALLAAASIPIKGAAFTQVDLAFPLTRTVFLEKAWVAKIGASVRVKGLRF